MNSAYALAGCVLACFAGRAVATQQYQIDALIVSLDRWMYPFGDFTGARTSAPVYSTLYSGYDIFDERDAEFLFGFNTSGQVPAGFAPFQYRIDSVEISTTVLVSDPSQTFIYDPSPDPRTSYLDPGDPAALPPRPADPDLTADPDPGRSIDLFGVAYRSGFSAATWAENSPFGPQAPQPRTRNAYPIDFGGSEDTMRDVSNNVADGFEPVPFSSGVAYTSQDELMTPGDTVADGAQIRFNVDLSRAGNATHVSEGLSLGKLNFIASGLHSATAFGAGPVTYPVFRTKESPLGGAPRLTLTVSICLADLGGIGGSFGADGVLDNNDFIVYIDAFFNANMDIADIGTTGGVFGRDGTLDNNDFIVFIDAFFAGCGGV